MHDALPHLVVRVLAGFYLFYLFTTTHTSRRPIGTPSRFTNPAHPAQYSSPSGATKYMYSQHLDHPYTYPPTIVVRLTQADFLPTRSVHSPLKDHRFVRWHALPTLIMV